MGEFPHKLTNEERIKGGKNSKRKSFDTRMQEWLQEEIEDGTTLEDALRKALIKYGLKGNIQAIKEIFDRAYGKAKQDLNVNAEGNMTYIMKDREEGEV